MGLALITPPVGEPVTLAEAKKHLRITHTDEDEHIHGLIMAARQYAEEYTHRVLMPQTWDWTMDKLPAAFDVPLPPLRSITSVKYIDTAGAEQTLASSVYAVDTASIRGRIVLAYGQVWPSTREQVGGVTVRIVAGYTIVPQPIKMAMLMLIGHLYENRETTISGTIISNTPLATDTLLNPYRVISL